MGAVCKATGYGKIMENTGTGSTYRQRQRSTHRVAYEMFNGAVPSDKCVCHRCDVQLCVNPDHLFLGTHDDNQKDKARKGRGPRGEINGATNLTKEIVLAVRASNLPGKHLAKQYGVTYKTIRNLINRQTWAHI